MTISDKKYIKKLEKENSILSDAVFCAQLEIAELKSKLTIKEYDYEDLRSDNKLLRIAIKESQRKDQ